VIPQSWPLYYVTRHADAPRWGLVIGWAPGKDAVGVDPLVLTWDDESEGYLPAELLDAEAAVATFLTVEGAARKAATTPVRGGPVEVATPDAEIPSPRGKQRSLAHDLNTQTTQ
jgi:hypothetical protein